MKRLIAVFLILVLTLSCAACQETGTTPTTEAPATTLPTEPSWSLPDVTVANPATYVLLGISDGEGNYISLTAYDNGEGQACVEYVGDVKKVGTFDLSVLHGITAELESVGLKKLNGQNIYKEGLASANMYVSYADGAYLSADYSGTVPKEFTDGYEALDAYFQKLVAHLPVYVPEPLVMGEVDEAALAELRQILAASGLEPLDMFSISDVPMDDYFPNAMGLSGTAGITRGTSCAPLMSAVAYSFVIATAEENADIDAISKDFSEHIDWNRWVCVSADNALIAQKGNMILCLVSSGDLYTQTAQAILASGWTELQTCKR